MNLNEALILAKKLARREHTPAELTAIDQFLRTAGRADAEMWMDEYYAALPAARYGKIDAQLLERLHQLELDTNISEADQTVIPVHRAHLLKRAWIRYAAAVIIIFGIGAYLYITNQKEKPSVTQTNPLPVQNDVAPGGNKAILTLGDGRKIVLDNTANGIIAQQVGSTVQKTGEGSVVYKPLSADKTTEKVVLNTMTTPRGGQFQLTLPDGTQVWLNAESSITYPTAFSGEQRKVSITGEAYFEVVKSKTKPFRVEMGNAAIEVLGTHFNVNTYKEEPTYNITLIEGSVIIKSVHTSLTLKPGQQGQVNPRTNNLSLAVRPNIEQAVAWKNGYFSFSRTPLTKVLEQLSRWYDVKVDFAGKKPPVKQVSGEMQRSLNLSQVLNILKGLEVQYRIEGRKLTIL